MDHTLMNLLRRPAAILIAVLVAAPLALAGPDAQDRDGERSADTPRPAAESQRGLERPGHGPLGHGGEGRGGWPEPDAEALTDEQIEMALEVLRAQNPHMAERLEALRESDPERFRGWIGGLWSRLRPMIFLKQRDPELFELRAAEQRLTYRAIDVARRLGRAEPDSPAAERLSGELREVVEAQFEARQQVLEYELARFEERIRRLREKLYDQRENREQIIERQYTELLEEKERRRGRRDREE